MTRIFGHYVPLEMLGLWLLEFLPCLLAIYLMLAAPPSSGVFDLIAFEQAIALTLAVSLTWIAIGLYRPELCLQTRRLFISTAIGATLALPALLVVAMLAGIDTGSLFGASPLRPVQFILTWVVLLFATRVAFRVALRFNLFARRVLIVGDAPAAARTREAIDHLRSGFFSVCGVVRPSDTAALVPAALAKNRVWAVVVTEEARGDLPQDPLMQGKHAGIHVYSDVEFREQQLRRIDLDHLAADWMLFAPGLSRGPLEASIRRGCDLLISLCVLVLTSPLMVFAALAIRFDSPGPVLYRQERVGQNGRVFTLLKFRSMRTDAESRGPAWASQRDPRVTRVGNFIRRTRIDELPQLINVLRGEMSFVGPRPERPHFVEQLREVIPFYHDRGSVKPGITGWAQVNYPYGASIEDTRQKLSYDLYYVKRRSLFLDFLILIATVRVILFQEGSR